MKKLILLLCLILSLSVAFALAEEDGFEPEEAFSFEEVMSESSYDESPAIEPEADAPESEESSFPQEETVVSEENGEGETDDALVGEPAPEENPAAVDEAEGSEVFPAEAWTDTPEVIADGEIPEIETEEDMPGFEEFAAEADVPGFENAAAETDIPEDAEAWFSADGMVIGGSLNEIIDLLNRGDTVYIRTSHTVHVRSASLHILAGVTFLPDAEAFDGDRVVRVYGGDPADGGEVFDFSDVVPGETGDLWFRVEARDSASPDEGDDAPETCEISVTPNAFTPGEWVNKAPVFRLSGIPEGEEDMIYAVIKFDSRIIPLSGSSFTPTEDGVYTLQFVIQNGLGDFADVSKRIDVWFDWTKPRATIAVSKTENYTVNITATDGLSGVEALSLDGGRTWKPALDGATYTYTAPSKATLPAGQIQVRDVAGNIYKSEQAYELNAIQTASTPKASSTSEPKSEGTSSHATAEDSESEAGSGFSLKMPEEPMRQLIINGVPMALTLMLETEGMIAPASFTGSFEPWYLADGSGLLSDQPNTLMLGATLDEAGDVFSCQWRINGEVFRELFNAGIDYVVFRAMDDLCAVPTAGFIGGTKYTELKMDGVSTKKFNYTLTMNVNRDVNTVTALTENDFSEDCDFTLAVSVEDVAYQMSNSVRSPIYYYDVYLGPEAMMRYPFGHYEG